jgi:crotonobetainyl-CoA:carnitine CoA-transferase CaiB-like acyl-CoA transferase
LSEPHGLLDGIRVLSLGTFIAGNHAATLLAELGADVAKIEARNRPEVLRTPPYAIGDPATEPSGVPNTVMFAALTRGQRGLSLDLALPQARSLFHRLVGVTDVVIENFGGQVLDRWGCAYEDLLRDKPNLVMLSLSGYGRTGPRANYLAYGSTMCAYTGLASAWGYTHGTLSDYITGVTGAVAAVAALEKARRHGTPCFLDVAQVDAMPPTLAPLYAGPLNTGRDEPYPQNRVPGSWLSGIVPSRGHDQWLAIDLEDSSDWARLCEFLERPDLLADDRETAEAYEPALKDALASWAATCSAHTAMRLMQRVGLAAVAVQDPEDLFRDYQLRQRHFLEPVDQPDLGRVTYPGSAQRWSKTPGRSPVPPPRLGEHTREILSRWLDLDDGELETLEADGAIFSANRE